MYNDVLCRICSAEGRIAPYGQQPISFWLQAVAKAKLKGFKSTTTAAGSEKDSASYEAKLIVEIIETEQKIPVQIKGNVSAESVVVVERRGNDLLTDGRSLSSLSSIGSAAKSRHL